MGEVLSEEVEEEEEVMETERKECFRMRTMAVAMAINDHRRQVDLLLFLLFLRSTSRRSLAGATRPSSRPRRAPWPRAFLPEGSRGARRSCAWL